MRVSACGGVSGAPRECGVRSGAIYMYITIGPLVLGGRLWDRAYKHWVKYSKNVLITSRYHVTKEDLDTRNLEEDMVEFATEHKGITTEERCGE